MKRLIREANVTGIEEGVGPKGVYKDVKKALDDMRSAHELLVSASSTKEAKSSGDDKELKKLASDLGSQVKKVRNIAAGLAVAAGL